MEKTSRRKFLKTGGMALASGLVMGHIPLIASTANVRRQTDGIPLDKKLDPAWVKSLYERGVPTVYSKSRNELRYIGMPIGGINAGGVYLGGDGRLWLWDIFNDNNEGVENKLVKFKRDNFNRQYLYVREGGCYVEPAQDIRPLEQGFALRFEYGGKTVVKSLETFDWDEVLFEAGYPVGTIRYIDKNLPVEVTLTAYSPFIPLEEDDSGLPATILSFSFVNTGKNTVKIAITGWLENKTGIRSASEVRTAFAAPVIRRNNKVVREAGLVAIDESLEALEKAEEVRKRPDVGTMCIAALDGNAKGYASVNVGDIAGLFDVEPVYESNKAVDSKLIGAVRSDLELPAEASVSREFLISWYFPNLKIYDNIEDRGRYYQNKFSSALDVSRYIGRNFGRLSSQTLLWAATWKDSTLPHWFLERTLLTIDTLATTTCHRFSSGRFWAWEGIGACPGTCTHVWQYAQAMGRIFPALERDCRERTDLGIAFREDGSIIFRAECETRPAIDGQAGSVLRCYREHQMSADDAFLQRNWDKIKKAVQFIISLDKNGDGMEDTPLENTLDAVWSGEIAWIVGLCIAAVKAGQRMAEETGDKAFARQCADFVRKGSANMDKHLFNGEYYIHRPDKEMGKKKLGSYNTCHIDQVMGQSWAYQVGLGEIQDNRKVKSALRSLWKYNYTPDVGPYIAKHAGWRPYALAGDGGMIINTNPANELKPYGEDVSWQAGYFHECMTGYEYEVAAHMIAEGMTDEGMTLVRSIHDRYHASKRNPYNEIECSDHYARAMASYGAFITACGFEYHGPKGFIRFAPKWNAADFKAPFTAAEGWGTYRQKQSNSAMECAIEPKYGRLQLSVISVDTPKGKTAGQATVKLNGRTIPAKTTKAGQTVTVTLNNRITIPAGEKLTLELGVKG
ncbi:MAG: hypothetical protein LBS54_06765 [Dysgonamonadaceae bacterium]|jgi:uncharacterized protein (DUF608 family)|nr:hypothetical protein [Dysgonamonadaceae bacterium]